MDVEHVISPANAIDAMAAIARQDDASVHHLRHCPRCRIAWYRVGAFRAGCTDPRVGVVVMGSIRCAPLPDVGVPTTNVSLGHRPLTNWHEAIREADHHGKLKASITAAVALP